MPLEARIKRWYYEAQRRGVTLQRILLHPDDMAEAAILCKWLPMRVTPLGGCLPQ